MINEQPLDSQSNSNIPCSISYFVQEIFEINYYYYYQHHYL